MSEIENHRQIVSSNFTSFFHNGTASFDERIFKNVLNSIENTTDAKKLSKNEYEKLKLNVQEIAKEIKSEAIEAEQNVKNNFIKAGLVLVFTWLCIKLGGGGNEEKKWVIKNFTAINDDLDLNYN